MTKKDGCPLGFYRKGNNCVTDVPLEIVRHMEEVIDYVYSDEAEDFAAETRNNPDLRKHHIFHHIAKVNMWLYPKRHKTGRINLDEWRKNHVMNAPPTTMGWGSIPEEELHGKQLPEKKVK